MLARRILVLLGALGALALCSVVPAATPELGEGPRLQRSVDEVVAAGVPGALLLVTDGGTTRLAVAGVADLETARPLASEDRFRIGSVTKTFVAALVLQLVAEDRLGLDDTVEKWLPGLLADGRSITLRHLLSHTSGLVDYAGESSLRRGSSARGLVAAAAHRPRLFPPGGGYAYSSTNYLVLGLVVEAATGASLREELERKLLEPLALRRTDFVPGPQIPGPHAHAYSPPVHDGVVSGPPRRDTSGESAAWAGASGAMVSDAFDIARFVRELLRGRVLPAAQLAEMERLDGRRYGLGLAVFPTPCGAAWGHTGNVLGYVTAVWSTRDGWRQVVATANMYPLPAAADGALHRALEAAFCG